MTEPTDETDAPDAPEVEDAPAETVAAPRRRPISRDRAVGPGANARNVAPLQARATAIEHARRDAKRRISAAPAEETTKLGRRTVRGLKVLMWSALISVIVVGLGLLLYFTPIMSARNIVVTGLSVVTQEEVVTAAAVPPGTPLLQVDTDAVAERIAAIRRIATARVQREYPSTSASHRCRTNSRGGQGFSGRHTSFRPRRRRLRTGAAAAGRALPRRRESRPERPGDQGRAGGDHVAAARGGGTGRPRSPRPRWPRSR